MSKAEELKQLAALTNFEGDFDLILQGCGTVLDPVQDDLDTIEDEMFISSADKLLSRWEKQYKVIPDPGDSIALRKENLEVRIALDGKTTPLHYVDVAALKGIILSTDDRIGFLMDFSLMDVDPMAGDDDAYTIQRILSVQHRFPFLMDFSLMDVDQFVDFDIRNSIEELFEREVRAGRKTEWSYLNLGFETGDFESWRNFDATIDSVIVRTGSFSAKLEAVGADINGVESTSFIFATGKKYQIDSWHNVTARTGGTYKFRIDYYSDWRATQLVSSDIIFFRTATTTGFEQGIKTVGPASTTPDFVIPAGVRAFRIKQLWDGTPTGVAYLDDIEITLI